MMILHHGKIIAYLDSESHRALQMDVSFSEIFESYVQIEQPKFDVLKWL